MLTFSTCKILGFFQCNFSRWLNLADIVAYNIQYHRPLETLPSLQGCPEGILLSILLLCPSESANDQRLGKFLLWIFAAEFPPDAAEFPPDDVSTAGEPQDSNLKFLRLSFCGYTCSFTLPAFVALLLTRWLVACTDRESGSHHVQQSCSPMVREEFIPQAEQPPAAPAPGAQVRFC